MPCGFRERLRQKSDTKGMQRRSSKATGLWGLLPVLEGKPFKETPAQPSLGSGQPAEVTHKVTIFLMSFTSSSRKWVSRRPKRWGSVWAEARACRSQKAWFRVFPRATVTSKASRALPCSSWRGLCTPGRGQSPAEPHHHSEIEVQRVRCLKPTDAG